MTAEVVVMNKYGVAMAADTVLTVAAPHGPKLYSNTTKLFHLSHGAPVAIMVHGNVEFSHFPWEVLINDYRDKLGYRTFETIEEYGNDFIDYLKGVEIDEDGQRHTVLNTLFGHFSELTRRAKGQTDEVNRAAPSVTYRQRIVAHLSSLAATLEQRPTIRPIKSGYMDFVWQFRREIFAARKLAITEALNPPLSRESLAVLWRLAYLYTIKDVFSPSSSGIVIAGFGSEQLLPSVRGYTIDGNVCGTIKHKLTARRDITKNNQAIVMPFAQTEMIQRFMRGVDGAYDEFMEGVFSRRLTSLANLMVTKYTATPDQLPSVKDELEKILQNEMEQLRRVTADYRQEWYTKPIIDSLKNVPKSELAVLAGSLVEITSLKRRMSTDVETVGEPIDVALLSKADGFIWIRDAHAHEIRRRAGDSRPGTGGAMARPASEQPAAAVAGTCEARRRQVSAILFADVRGDSKVTAGSGKRAHQRTTRTVRLIRSLVGDYGGEVRQAAGNGILALFDTAASALQFALTIQKEICNDAAWHVDEEPIAFRVGIDVGEVLLGEGDARGLSVEIASGIQALAQPGSICITEAARRAVHSAPGLMMRRLGPHTLKNVTEPVEVFAIESNGSPAQVAEGPPEAGQIIAPPPGASVAVLPLDNLSGDPRDGHLCDGFTGDIITNLSRFRELLVIARHSAFRFRSRDVSSEKVADQLGVRYLLTGGLQRSGRKLRLRVHLIEPDTDRVIWSDRYDGDLGDLFAFQDDVTAMIAARLAVQIATTQQRRLLAQCPPDLRAYGLTLRGQDLGLRFCKEANLHARRLFEQAAEIDPHYGRSYAGISRTFNLAWRYRWAPSPDAALEQAVELARAAISHDSLDARGYGELGFAKLYKKHHDESLAAYHQAFELNPNDADLLAEMGDAMTYCGQTSKAIDLLKRAMRLNPYHPDWYTWYLGEAYFYAGDYQKAIQTLQQMRDQSEAHRLLASSYAHVGLMEEASHHAREVLRIHPNFSLEHWRNVPPNKDPRENEVFVEGLRKAGLR